MKNKSKNTMRPHKTKALKNLREQVAVDLQNLDLNKLSSQSGLVFCPHKPLTGCIGPNSKQPNGICGAKTYIFCSRCQKVSYCDRRCRINDLKRHLESGECMAVEKVEMQIHKDGEIALKATKNIAAGEVIFEEDDLLALPDTKNSGEELLKAPPCYSCHKTLPSEYNYRCTSCGLSLCGYDCEEASVHEYECAALDALNMKASSRGKSITPESLKNEYMDICILRTLSFFSQAEYFEKWKQLNLLVNSRRFKRIKSIQKLQDDNPIYKLSMKFTNNNEELVNRVADLIATYASTDAVEDEDGSRFKTVFLLKSSMRHSCSSNSILRPENITNSSVIKPREKLVIQATEDIPAGSIITFDFSEDETYCRLWSSTMMRLYCTHESIECVCIRCKDPTELKTYAGSQTCMNCNSGYLLPVKMYSLNGSSKRSEPNFESNELQCTYCCNKQSYKQLQDILKKIQTDYDNIMNAVDVCKLIPLAAFIAYYEKKYLHCYHHLILKAKCEYLTLARKKQFWDCGYKVDQFGNGVRLTNWSMKHNPVTPFPWKWNRKSLLELETRSKYAGDCFNYLKLTGQCCNPFFVHCEQEIALTDIILYFHRIALNDFKGEIMDVLCSLNDATLKTKMAEKDYETFFFRNTLQDFNIILIRTQLRQLEAIKDLLIANLSSEDQSDCIKKVTNAFASGLLLIPSHSFALRDDDVSIITIDKNANDNIIKREIREMNREAIQACMKKIGKSLVGKGSTSFAPAAEPVLPNKRNISKFMNYNDSDGNKGPESDNSEPDNMPELNDLDENRTSLFEKSTIVENTLMKMLATAEDWPTNEDSGNNTVRKSSKEEESLFDIREIETMLKHVIDLKEASQSSIPLSNHLYAKSRNASRKSEVNSKSNALKQNGADCSEIGKTYKTLITTNDSSEKLADILKYNLGVDNGTCNNEEQQLTHQTRNNGSNNASKHDHLAAAFDLEAIEVGDNGIATPPNGFYRNPSTSKPRQSGPLKVNGVCMRKQSDSEIIEALQNRIVNKQPKLPSSANHNLSETDLETPPNYFYRNPSTSKATQSGPLKANELYMRQQTNCETSGALQNPIANKQPKLPFSVNHDSFETDLTKELNLTSSEPKMEVLLENQQRNYVTRTDPYPQLEPLDIEKHLQGIMYFFNELS